MKKYNINKIIKTIIQIIFFLLLPGLISITFLQAKSLINNIYNGNFNNIFNDSYVFIIIAVLTVIIGRFFCGYICIFGSLSDWLNIISTKILKIKQINIRKYDKKLKLIKFLILIFIVSLVWTNIVNIDGMSPWDSYGLILDISFMISNYLIGTIILILIMLISLFIERFFCRYMCPLGALLSIFSKFRIIKIHKPKINCNLCKACTLKCSMGIDLDSTSIIKSTECINCLNCTSICPKNNAKYKIDEKVANEYLITIISISTFLIMYYGISSNLKKKTSNNIDDTNTTETVEDTTDNEVINKVYNDGTYTGSATGYKPNLTVSVTIKNDLITNIEVVSSSETPEFLVRAESIIPEDIIDSQSIKVSIVSGATRSSVGIINAVNNALSKAKI